ncbi:MAG: phosphoglucomutase/phosphomannomutase family protein [Chloroflexi bacterium]|nr:phosphoglucomutase/phosphomannomutase family protein [Chloroflexota bacterium]
MAIKFGTDGWRALIAEEYTFDNVRLCAQGTAAYLKQAGLASRGLIVGYDTRFASEDFAAAVAEVTTANGVTTFLCDKPAPTPVVSYNLVTLNAGGGIIITASHNPARWNGFKYKPDYGGSASPEVVEELEAFIAEAGNTGSPMRMALAEAESKGLLEYIDPEPVYLGHIANLVDVGNIRRAGLKVVVDSMYGAGAGYFSKLLSGGSTEVIELHGERNPAFPGMAQPEPLAHNLGELMAAVPSQSADIGLATDGDADRLGIVDENGKFVTTLESFALLCLHHLEVLNRRGPLVRSITMTSMIDRLGEIYGVPVFDTEVGFKYLGPVMMREDALLAGEESGGYAIQGNIPERDGILSGLLILDMMVRTGKTVSQLLEMLIEKVGPHHYARWDIEFDPEERAEIHSRLRRANPSSIAGKRVDRIDTRDGYRFVLEGGYWALVRFSGTEPLLRIYAEAESPEDVEALLEEARDMAGV